MKMCHCGKPLHYANKSLQDHMEMLVSTLGEHITVVVSGRTFLVPRHYIALHGLKATDAPSLGFQEVTDGQPQDGS